jgi:lipoprotein NlpI
VALILSLSVAAFKIAVVDFGRAIGMRPDRFDNYYFRGSCYSQLGNFDQVSLTQL